MIRIYIDNIAYDVRENKNLLETILTLGLDLPYFCWHPALGSVGACRQCAVKQYKDENDKQGRIIMACMTPVTDKLYISIHDKEAEKFRASIIEWLMVNHPHDCPVCDEGGECHLQDMTVMSGHNYRRYGYQKRTFHNQYLGPFINHEMNRCIACYRCVRFYNDYAGGHDLQALASHNHVYFGRHQDGVLENEFSGNLVEVCPTGVFTDKTLKMHYTRKWDLQNAPSICHQCGLGCNIIAGERKGILRRILNRYNQEVNGYFICDRGRFGYGFVNSEKRILSPLIKNNHEQEVVSKEAALNHLKTITADRERVIGIGSPRASIEANYALKEFAGANRFYHGSSAEEYTLIDKIFAIMKNSSLRSASLHDAEQADAVFVLGEDVTNSAPRLALSLRQAAHRQPKQGAAAAGIQEWHDAAVHEFIQNDHGPLTIATPAPTKLDDVATYTYRAAPDDIARLGFAVAHALNGRAPQPANLPDKVQQLAARIAETLKKAERPLIVSGAGLKQVSVIEAAANVAWALNGKKEASVCFIVPECDSMAMPFFQGKDLEQAYKAVGEGGIQTVIVMENDLYRRAPASEINRFLDQVEHLVVIDQIETATTRRAELVFPASSFAEGSGTLINNEGRMQTYFRVFPPVPDIRESWRWISETPDDSAQTEKNRWETRDRLIREVAAKVPGLHKISETAPDADFRIAGQKIPRETPRYSGRTAMYAGQSMFEPAPQIDPDSALAFSMEGYSGHAPPALLPFYWSPGWNSVQSLNKYQQEVGGPLAGGNPGIRLFEPGSKSEKKYFNQLPEKFQPREGHWLLVPLYHIFGSEELSVFSPGLDERVPGTYLALQPQDAEKLGVENGDQVGVTIDGEQLEFPVKLMPDLANGLAGLPSGLPDSPVLTFPHWCVIKKRGKHG
jgi:NADH-quinone oxidoreductase subunit G